MDIYRPLCCPSMDNILGGTEAVFKSSQGNIFFNYDGEGEPLLLIHGINAGASNVEWRSNYKSLCKHFKVYALDLPGFARSSKMPSSYKAQDYIQPIIEFIQKQMQRPAFILSSGLSAAYCCALAYSRSDLVKSLALVTPSGLVSNNTAPCESSFTIYSLFASPIQGDGLYNAFVSRESIRYFLSEFIYSNPRFITDQQVEVLYQASHQCPHAKYAPASFVAGLSNIDISPYFCKIKIPILIVWGAKAKLNPVENIYSFIKSNPSASAFIFNNSGLVPQTEEAQGFNTLVVNFFKHGKIH